MFKDKLEIRGVIEAINFLTEYNKQLGELLKSSKDYVKKLSKHPDKGKLMIILDNVKYKREKKEYKAELKTKSYRKARKEIGRRGYA